MKFFTFILALALPLAAFAEDMERPIDAEVTVLNFSEQGNKKVEQDRIRASLRIEKEASSTREIQNFINQKMQAAMAKIKAVKDVDSETGSYNVYQRHNRKIVTKWFGSQSITLDSANAEEITKLVAELQDMGFQSSGLSYYLSKEKMESFRDELIEQAISRMKARAESLAKQLGARSIHFANISFDGNNHIYSQAPRMMRAMAMDSAMEKVAEPVVEAGETEVQITVSAKVYLAE